MNASDVMTTRIISASPDTPLSQLIHMMLDNAITAVPIVQDGELLGIVSDGDLLRRAETGTEHRLSRWLALLTPNGRLASDYVRTHGRKAHEVMTRDVVSVTEATPLVEVAELLAAKRFKRVPVMRDGKLAGMVSRENLLQALASRLPDYVPNQDDRTIRAALLTELHNQTWADAASGINVVVTDGVVHLWGQVPDDATRQAIIVAAENAPGVSKVEDHLERSRAIDPMDRPNWPSPAPP
jgi:CBS domain-containing protein